MAIAFDAGTDGGSAVSTTLTYAHTTSGSDRFLVVNVDYNGTTDIVSSVTYNSVGMTRVGGVLNVGGLSTYMYVLHAPASGANNVVITLSGSTTIRSACASYTGVNQSSTVDNSTTNSALATTSIATSLTPVADNCWVVAVQANNGGLPSAGAGTTRRATSSGALGMFDNNAAITPAASTTLNINFASGDAEVVMASIAPASAAASTYRRLALTGVGQ